MSQQNFLKQVHENTVASEVVNESHRKNVFDLKGKVAKVNICQDIIVPKSNDCQIKTETFSHNRIFSPVRAGKNLHFAHEFCLNCFRQNRTRLKRVKIFPMQIIAKLPEKSNQLQICTKSI